MIMIHGGYCSLSVKINTCEKPHHSALEYSSARMCKKIVGAFLKTSNWSSVADDTITQGGGKGAGSPFYICESQGLRASSR